MPALSVLGALLSQVPVAADRNFGAKEGQIQQLMDHAAAMPLGDGASACLFRGVCRYKVVHSCLRCRRRWPFRCLPLLP